MLYRYVPIPTSQGVWHLFLYVNTGRWDGWRIVGRLRLLGCRGKDMDGARENIMACNLDTGLTYSNLEKRKSVMVIARASSPREFFNSYEHETQHLKQHIATSLDMPLWGEEIAYLSGNLACALYPHIKHFLCDCGI